MQGEYFMNAFEERKRIANIYDLEKYDGHVELIDGNIAVENYTSPQHNIVFRNIAGSIQNYLDHTFFYIPDFLLKGNRLLLWQMEPQQGADYETGFHADIMEE